ncbi:hypothetical protein ANN_22885 [Periplaneta americana]|uniref:Uncharacterized protein n=1 Tax=Periplaneta americana TaxID=6978 RepID=A0ABQ8SJX4_PERAM|nr:hypothetical protein ANN_22885 [Periplaneta americana]
MSAIWKNFIIRANVILQGNFKMSEYQLINKSIGARTTMERDLNQAHQVNQEKRPIYEPCILYLSAKYNIPLFNCSKYFPKHLILKHPEPMFLSQSESPSFTTIQKNRESEERQIRRFKLVVTAIFVIAHIAFIPTHD